MFFHYADVEKEFPRIINHWLENYERSAPAFNLYFSSKSGDHKYLESRFLSLAQGVETFHRRNSTETVFSDDDFTEIVANLIQACPSQHKDWLRGKLSYSNELTLRRRLKQMMSPFTHFLGDIKLQKFVVGKIVDTRNYLTHYDDRLKSNVAHGRELWALCMILECLFQLHMLKLCGIQENQLSALVAANHVFRQKLSAMTSNG